MLLLLVAHGVTAVQLDDISALLKRADDLRITNYAEFATSLVTLEHQSQGFSPAQLEYLQYLQGWKSAYDGDNDTAISRLGAIISSGKDVTLRFRAGATVVTILSYARRYEEAYARLSQVLELLPRISDGVAREQGLLTASELYAEVGQYDLSLSYAKMLIDENWRGRGVCKGSQQKMRTLYESGRLTAVGPELQAATEACVKLGEVQFANSIRIVAARIYLDKKQYDDAIDLLKTHYEEVKATRNPRMRASVEALLADAYHRKGAAALARESANNVIGGGERYTAYTEALVTAYRVLYEVAKDQGDFRSALAYHEDFAAADKAYLNDLSARHLAYQKVNHENIANKLQVDALNEQNRVLQLQKQLGAKAVEASRLYIALLALILVFIALWAYRTKRSQLHFMSLSQLDGLTGICNRPHFIEQSERALEYSRKMGQDACMILCDLDYFKAINDKHGHATGDFVLRRLVSACKPHMRKSDIFGRFGGEEFAILLPGCALEEGRQRSEELRSTIAAIIVNQNGGKITISASFGVTATSTSGYQLRELLAHADSALYEAKRAGRNRVVLYDSMTEVFAAAVADPVTRSGRRYGPA